VRISDNAFVFDSSDFAAPWPRGRVCVVDHDDPVLDATAVLLRTHGFVVTAYNSVTRLVADLNVDTYACLVLDMHMPTLTGLEALETLRGRHVVTPAVIVTGAAEPQLMVRIVATNALLLQKPVLERELLTAIRWACSTGPEGRKQQDDPQNPVPETGSGFARI
jgi:FixJ family two-component response regulator